MTVVPDMSFHVKINLISLPHSYFFGFSICSEKLLPDTEGQMSPVTYHLFIPLNFQTN